MKQIGLASNGFELSPKRTRKRVFLDEMEHVVPWARLVALIEPYHGGAKTGRPPFSAETLLRVHFMQQWFGLSDPAMEEALHDVPLYRAFAGLDAGVERLPDETTILRFRHLLERHDLASRMLAEVNALLTQRGLLLKRGTAVDATLIAAPSSTKNRKRQRDPEMHQTKKGNQWYFGMKAHIGADAESGLVHTVVGTAANVADVTQVEPLLHGQEVAVHADAGYTGAEKRAGSNCRWYIAAKRGTLKALPDGRYKQTLQQLERLKAQLRARVEHPFRVIKRQFGYTKVRYRGLVKNTHQLKTLFALSNLWMVRAALLAPS